MKQFLLLLGSILLLLLAWFLMGTQGPQGAPAWGLVIPLDTADRPALVRSADQLLTYQPTPETVVQGARLLEHLLFHLKDEEWPKAAAAIYTGWERIHRTKGSQPLIEPFAEKLLDRLAPSLGPWELQQLVESIQKRDYYASRIDGALVRAAREKPLAVAEAAAFARDYERARSAIRLAPTANLGAGGPEKAERLSAALDVQLAGAPRMKEGVELWIKAPPTDVIRAVILETGLALARAGKDSRDFSALQKAAGETREVAGAPIYWGEVLAAAVGPAVERAYTETHVLEALVGIHAETFGDLGFLHLFWKGMADKVKGEGAVEAGWRIECLKRAAQAAPDDKTRILLAGRIAKECRAQRESAKAKTVVQDLERRASSPVAKAELAALTTTLAQEETAQKAAAEQFIKEQKRKHLEAGLSDLKKRREDARTRKAPANVQSDMDSQIRQLEKLLTE